MGTKGKIMKKLLLGTFSALLFSSFLCAMEEDGPQKKLQKQYGRSPKEIDDLRANNKRAEEYIEQLRNQLAEQKQKEKRLLEERDNLLRQLQNTK